MIVTIAHVRGVQGLSKHGGLCVPHVRDWFRRNNVDMKDFMRNGIDEERLLAIGDAFSLAVVEHARRMEAAKHGR